MPSRLVSLKEAFSNHVSDLAQRPLPRPFESLLVLAAVCGPLALYAAGMGEYTLGWDDFPYVRDSMTWERTCDSLWKPFSNHLFPPFRLLTWFLVHSAGHITGIPQVLPVAA